MAHTHTQSLQSQSNAHLLKGGGAGAVIDFSENTLPKSAPDILAMDRKQ